MSLKYGWFLTECQRIEFQQKTIAYVSADGILYRSKLKIIGLKIFCHTEKIKKICKNEKNLPNLISYLLLQSVGESKSQDSELNTILIIILGIVAGLLLVVVIILLIYIYRKWVFEIIIC